MNYLNKNLKHAVLRKFKTVTSLKETLKRKAIVKLLAIKSISALHVMKECSRLRANLQPVV